MAAINDAVANPANASVVATIQAVAKQLGVDPNLALATAYQESKFNPTAVGDRGTSFGLFQLHQGGELGSMTPQQAFDPARNAQTSLSVVRQAALGGGTPGQVAARAQRPADPTGYARSVDALYLSLTGGIPATPALPALAAGPASGSAEAAAAGLTYDEGSITMPSVIPNIPRRFVRHAGGAAVLVGSAVIGAAGLFLLLGRRLPAASPVGAVQGVISQRRAGRHEEARLTMEGRARQRDAEDERRAAAATPTADELRERRNRRARERRARDAEARSRAASAEGRAAADEGGMF